MNLWLFMQMEAVASNEVVHFISQLVISAWIHSSASDKQPTASPELRNSHTSRRTQTHTLREGRKRRFVSCSETAWPLPQTWGKDIMLSLQRRPCYVSASVVHRPVPGGKLMSHGDLREITRWPFHCRISMTNWCYCLDSESFPPP